MGKNIKREFEWFGFDEDPIGKYKQPKENIHKPRPGQQGYPVGDDVNRTGTKTNGRWVAPYGEKKTSIEIRG